MLHDLDYFFDMVDIFDDFLHLLHDGNPLDNFLYFNQLRSYISDLNDFFLFYFNFPYSFNDPGNLYNFFNQFLDVLIHLDNLWNYSLNFNNLRDFDEFLYNFLNLINSGNGS